MAKPKKIKPSPAQDLNQQTPEEILSELELFEEWKRKILPELRNRLTKGASAKEIAKEFESYAAARAVTIAITEPDSGKALAAIKDIQDRASGKATETKKIQHQLAELTDDELDAVLLTEMEKESEEDGEEEPILQ